MKLTLICLFVGVFALAYSTPVYELQDFADYEEVMAPGEYTIQGEAARYRRDLYPVCIKPLFSYQQQSHASCFTHCFAKGKRGRCEGDKCVCSNI